MIYFKNIIPLYLSVSDDTITSIFAVLLLILFYKISRWYEKNNWPEEGNLSKGQPMPNKIVFNAINTIWDDKSFIDEFRYILYDEGNLDGCTKEIYLYHVDCEGEGTRHQGRIWYNINCESYNPPLITLRIIERVANTIQFQNQILKYNLIGKDVDDFKKLFMHVISKREFHDNAIDYIIKLKDIKPGQDVLEIDVYGYTEKSRSLKINPWELLGATI